MTDPVDSQVEAPSVLRLDRPGRVAAVAGNGAPLEDLISSSGKVWNKRGIGLGDGQMREEVCVQRGMEECKIITRTYM